MCMNLTKNSQSTTTKGYSVDGVRCRGAINSLKKSFYGANFRKFGDRRRSKYGSSKALGDAFHRQVFHKYKCGHVVCTCPKNSKRKCRCKPTCLCKERFGTRTRKLKKNALALEDMLKSFSKFLKETGLHVYDCETIVGCTDLHVATSIDVLCVDNLVTPTAVYVIELKTGYTVQLHTVRTLKGTSRKMSGPAGSSIDNCTYNHHQLQLWFGVEALKRTHSIDATGGYIVYVNRGRRLKYYAAEGWWFKSPSMSTSMYEQLKESCRWRVYSKN